jgi:pyruvate kinase
LVVVFLPSLECGGCRWGVKNDVDYIAASFIRKPEDVHEIRAFLDSQLALYQPKGHPRPLIISKIESTEGLRNFNEILDVSDGIMVRLGTHFKSPYPAVPVFMWLCCLL